MKKRVRVASSLDVSDYEQLEQIALRLHEPISMVVRRLLQDALLEKKVLNKERAHGRSASGKSVERD